MHLDGGIPLVRCRHCHGMVKIIHTRQHLKKCNAYQRRQKLGRVTFEKNGKRLYAIAIQRLEPTTGVWKPEMHYAHGANPSEAKNRFLASEMPRERARLHIVDVGLAIGMFSRDRDGLRLTAD